MTPHRSHAYTLPHGYCAGCGQWRGSLYADRACAAADQPEVEEYEKGFAAKEVDWFGSLRSAG